MTIRLLIVDDQSLTRVGLRVVLQDAQDVEVVGEAESGPEAVRLATQLNPNVVLMDLKMPGGDGIEATRAIKQQCPATQVLILTVYSEPGLFRKAIAAGAVGYVLKDISPENMIRAIRAVHQGRTMINTNIARQLLEELASNGFGAEPVRRGLHGLTDRDLEVLVEVARGLADKEIAAKLFLSESTVKSHLRSIYRRLGLRNRAHAAAWAIEKNLLQPQAAWPRPDAAAEEHPESAPAGPEAPPPNTAGSDTKPGRPSRATD
jgi:two-component system NarL family response regulator